MKGFDARVYAFGPVKSAEKFEYWKRGSNRADCFVLIDQNWMNQQGLLLSSTSLAIMSVLSNIDYVDFSQKSLIISVLAIAFNPTAWNAVARNGVSTFFFTREDFSVYCPPRNASQSTETRQ